MSAAPSRPRIPVVPPAPQSGPELRAKPLRPLEARTERPTSAPGRHAVYAYADVVDLACHRSGRSNREIAAACGVDERVVRDIRHAVRVITVPRLMLFPADVAVDVLCQLLRQLPRALVLRVVRVLVRELEESG